MPTFRFCECCKQYFEEELEIHHMNCTKSSNDANQCVETKHLSNSELDQSLDQHPVEKERICEFCSDTFSSEEELSIHREVCEHEEVKCETCSVRVKRRNMSKHMKEHSIKVHLKECFYCGKEMEEEELKVHSATCDLSPVRCEKCIARIPKRYMAHHLSVDCVKRMIQCEYCNLEMVADTLQEHFEICTLIPVYCENKCGEEIRRIELQQHLHEVCPKRLVECQYCARNLEFELLETHYSECEKFPVPCPKVCGESVQREDMERHLDEACKKSYTKCMYQAVSCTFEGFPVDIRKHIQDNNVFHAEITNKKIGDLSIVVENQKDVNNTLQETLKKTAEKVSELEETLKKMKEITSKKFLWKIEGVSENLKLCAFDEALYSDTFYDSEYGYNLQVYLYLNGYDDGEVFRDCVAIFIRICPGKYDSVLEWPFRKRVIFTLIDQKDRTNDVAGFIEGFEDECFQKPDSDTPNCGYGWAPFITHDKVESGKYICDNMFIEVKTESIDV